MPAAGEPKWRHHRIAPAPTWKRSFGSAYGGPMGGGSCTRLTTRRCESAWEHLACAGNASAPFQRYDSKCAVDTALPGTVRSVSSQPRKGDVGNEPQKLPQFLIQTSIPNEHEKVDSRSHGLLVAGGTYFHRSPSRRTPRFGGLSSFDRRGTGNNGSCHDDRSHQRAARRGVRASGKVSPSESYG